MQKEIELTINGDIYLVTVKPSETLMEVLRNKLGLTGTKRGCDTGDCGACTVIMEGKAVRSCLILAISANGKSITTIEGLADGENLHPLQKAFVEHGAIQCGYCTPGMVMTSKAFLDENPTPTKEEIKTAISGNLCRCTGYTKIIEAIEASSESDK
jgi:carbon-monoxide dehydrogenase small subunit